MTPGKFIRTIFFSLLAINPCEAFSQKTNIPLYKDVPVIIPFEFKQSTLNYEGTFKRIDSVAQILMTNDSIVLSVQGYANPDEGSDSICYWLSLNRALAVKSYLEGRGLNFIRVWHFEGVGSKRKQFREPKESNYAVELVLRIPLPPPANWKDADGDGISDENDGCPNEFGYSNLNGCPDRHAIIVPFEPEYAYLSYHTYRVLDSVITILRKQPGYKLRIEGHAYKTEGIERFCRELAQDRADIVNRYLLSRNIDAQRIISITNLSKSRPVTAGRNPMEIARNSRAEIYFIKPEGE